MIVLQINTTINSGSTGRIAEDIGKLILLNGHQSYIAAGESKRPSSSQVIRIGNDCDKKMHGLKTRIFDRHGFGSTNATKSLIKKIEQIKPDVIGLHNLHGYYMNIEVLFEYLHQVKIPVLWTLFDCWAFTGHCSYFDDINCKKWESTCFKCPKKDRYPSSYFLDNSRLNFLDKTTLFTKPSKLHIVVHSKWLKGLVEKSFLRIFTIHLINSGIDLEVFRPVSADNIKNKFNLVNKQVILGVANIWDKRKGLEDFMRLLVHLSNNQILVLVGLSKKQLRTLPKDIIGIERTESIQQLAEIYSAADVFINPTFQDNFPTTNLEALACGTPVITYNTGGSPEAIDNQTGIVVEKGDIEGLYEAIQTICKNGKDFYSKKCRERAVHLYNKEDRYKDYMELYKSMLQGKVY